MVDGTRNSDGNVSDTAISIRFDNGTLVSLQSTDSDDMTHAFTITGSKGALSLETNPWQPVDADTDTDTDDHDAFFHQVQMVNRHVTASHTKATRPGPRLNGSTAQRLTRNHATALRLGSCNPFDLDLTACHTVSHRVAPCRTVSHCVALSHRGQTSV